MGLFQFFEVVLDFLAVGEFDRGLLVFVVLDFLLLAGLGGIAGAGFEFVGEGVDVGAAVGEDALHGQQASAGVVEFLAGFGGLRSGVLRCLLPGGEKRGVVGIAFDIFLGR